VADLLLTWPPRRVETDAGDIVHGLPVRLHLQRASACADIDLGDEARFWPSDEALQRWRTLAGDGRAEVVYEGAA
jgi:DNA polymerase-3 subunit alpha